MAKPTQSKADLLIENTKLLAEIERMRQDKWVAIIGSNVNTLIIAACVGFCAVCFYWSIDSLAGRTTNADILMNILADIRFERVVAVTAGGGGIIYGARQRQLRLDTIRHFEAMKREQELLIDPSRTSSDLTSSGETNPLDRGNI